LASFCRNVGLDPDELVKLKRRQIEEIVQRHCDNIVGRGRSKQFARLAMACLKTFFVCNGFNRENGRGLRLKGYYVPSRIDSSEYVPTLKEALTMADRAGGKRNRAIILTAITSGLRNTALRALRVGDVIGELQENRPLLIKVEPSWNQRIAGACKGSIQYHTFVARVAANAIESMLCERKSIFGSLSPQEPLFASNYNQLPLTERPSKPLSAKGLQDIIKKAAQAADIGKWKNVCVKSLRKVFEAALRNPLADATQMDHKDQEFLMGHILPGSQENYYDRTKVERLRELYSKVVFEDTSHRQNMRLEVTRGIAKALGLDISKISAIRVQELGRPLTSQEEEELLEQEIKLSRQRQNQEEQKIIQPSELDQYVTSGWNVGVQLADGRVVVRKRPTTAP
jgi:integrase